MADNKLDQKQQAQFLYMAGGKTQKEIATLVGVTERTIHSWIHQCAWDKLRLASFQAPATIADNLCSQLVELQNTISAREPGQRFPTPQEAETTRKLINSLEKMKKYPSLAQNMQILETFRNYMRPVDKDFTRQLGVYTERFLTAKSINGYAPFQVEYGVDPVPPVLPFYDEVDEPLDPALPRCADKNSCLNKSGCTYPHCQKPDWATEPTERIKKYNVPLLHFELARTRAVAASLQKPEATGSSADNMAEHDSIENDLIKPEATGSNDTVLCNTSRSLGEGRGEAPLSDINKQQPKPEKGLGCTDSSELSDSNLTEPPLSDSRKEPALSDSRRKAA